MSGVIATNPPLIIGSAAGPWILSGAVDPSTGVPAPLGSIYMETTSGLVYWKSGAADTAWSLIATAFTAGFFGDGSDGNVVAASGTLARDMFYNNLTIPAGVTLDSGGYRIFVRGTLTVEATGVIDHPGGNGSGATRGDAATAGSLAASVIGGTGTATNGGNATSITASMGGAGGAGGASASGTGGNGGNVTAPTAANGGFRSAMFVVIGQMFGISGTSAGTNTPVRGGSGGGAGAGNGASTGGGGGGGGGTVMVAARTCVNNGTIRARGGDGFTPAGANAAGGGGGGGGVCLLVTDFFTGNEPEAPGGSPGTGNGTGASGVAGSAGTALRFHS